MNYGKLHLSFIKDDLVLSMLMEAFQAALTVAATQRSHSGTFLSKSDYSDMASYVFTWLYDCYTHSTYYFIQITQKLSQ